MPFPPGWDPWDPPEETPFGARLAALRREKKGLSLKGASSEVLEPPKVNPFGEFEDLTDEEE